MYRGFGATIIAYGPASAVWWCTYETSKKYISDNDPREYFGFYSKNLPKTENGHVQNYFAQIVSGGLAGFITSVLVNPLDVVKTRLQTQERVPNTPIIHGATKTTNGQNPIYYKSLLDGLKHMIRTEGYPSLMKGVLPRVISNVPMSAFSSLTYEFLMKLSRKDGT